MTTPDTPKGAEPSRKDGVEKAGRASAQTAGRLICGTCYFTFKSPPHQVGDPCPRVSSGGLECPGKLRPIRD